jgi:Arc/MetJ family transcription regulator
MRTTLTLDDDVAAQLAWLREERKLSLRDAVNMAMRKGINPLA